MTWDRSTTLGLAKASCFSCKGIGIRRTTLREKEVPCNCVFRAIFRACYNRFRHCAEFSGQIGAVSLEFCSGKEGRRSYGRKREEYIADFCLVSRRSLDDADYQLFKFHFLLGADWRLCCRRLKIDRGTFFHRIYALEQYLGRVYATLKPHALYPLDEYFAGRISCDRLGYDAGDSDDMEEKIAA